MLVGNNIFSITKLGDDTLRKMVLITLFLLLLLFSTFCVAKGTNEIAIPDLTLVPTEKEGLYYSLSAARYGITLWDEKSRSLDFYSKQGLSPVDNKIYESYECLIIIKETYYDLVFPDDWPEPDSIIVYSWDKRVYADVENAGHYQTYPDGVIEINDAKVKLKPGRIYDIEIKWEESEENRGFSGSVDYYIVTEGNGSSNEGDQHF